MIVVTDTSVVLNLAWLKREVLMFSLFKNVVAPGEVKAEFERLAAVDARFTGLLFPQFIAIQQPKKVPSLLADNPSLDPGERSALALALELKASAFLIDERTAREVANQLGLRTIGLLGILVEGKRRNLLPAIRPLIDALEAEAEFRIHPDLRARILQQVKELP